ncbi:KilA-N domain-containing protein [Janthinobacterium sp. GB4P2]|uniref:KilA-N domain-containing protein n=1 Tax=Janthinobacterium sp. GB4P2 TaxID=3424189 RepID=UPI003F263828
MNDRVSEELLAEAAGRHAARISGVTSIVKAEYNGFQFTFQDNGWFNATAAAKRYGKRPNDWLALPETERYILARCEHLKVGKSHFVKTSRGGNTRESGFAGTWLHPKLAVIFARWLDVDFEIWCDEQIDLLLRGDPLDEGEADELTTVRDRLPLLEVAHHVFTRTGIFYPQTYAAINAAAGSENYRTMKKGQAARVLPQALRINTGTDTQEDWERLHVSKRELSGDTQMELGFSDLGLSILA